MANQLNKYGITIEAQTPSNISTHLSGSEDTVLLYASGSGANAALYVKSGGNTQKQLGVDIDQYSALGGTGLHDSQDHFLFSDNGTEKKITWANLYGAVFGKVSGDATVAAGGGLTIAAGAVEHGMLADDIISGQDELAQGGLVAGDEFMVSDGGTVKRLGADNFATDLLALSSEAALDVAADYIVFLDGGATGGTKKEQLSDVVGNMAGDGLAASSGVLAVSVDDSSIEIDSDSLRVKASGITNAMLNGSIANAKLSNSAITIGGTSTSLGGTITALTGLTDLDLAAGNRTIFDTVGANNLTVGASGTTVIIPGNLTVQGSTTSVDSTTINISQSFTF